MRSLILFLGFIFFSNARAQSPEKALEQLYKRFPHEKAVLVLSKPAYLAGENIYFKAYVLNGYEPSDISTNLYTELYDKEKKLLDKQIIPLLRGSGDGHFTLPAWLAEDVYYVRAYTHWMLNFDEKFQCIKPVPVYNTSSGQSLRRKPVQWKAQAFAESGNLLEGAVANIAVRLFTEGSLPQTWSGRLLDNAGNTFLSNVTVYNRQIGQVRFVPEAGKTYKLEIKDSLGNRQEILLPPVATSGVSLQTTAGPTHLRYGILFKNLPGAGKGYKLVAAFNHQPVFMASIAKSTGEISGTFDISNLPAGVLQLSLFDEKGAFVLERLCFLHQSNLQPSEPAVSTDTLSFAPKGRNRWRFTIDSTTWQSYAVQVADASVPLPNDFISSIYLTSDFTLPVCNADWYFESVTLEKKEALDAFLLTEKWSRFQWNAILQNRFPSIRFQPDTYLNYVGTVKRGNKLQPNREMNLIMRAADSSTSFVQVKTDSTGSFYLRNIFFTDSVKIYYQPSKQKFLEGEVTISFESLNRFFPLNSILPATEWTTGPRTKNTELPIAIRKAAAQRTNEMLLNEKGKVMNEVVITTKARNATEVLDKQLSSSLFSGGDATIFDFVNEDQTAAMSYSNILEWMQGRLPGFSIRYEEGTAVPYVRGTPAQVFINEMNVGYEAIGSIAVADIAMIKVFRNGFLGSFGGASAVAIYLRTGNMPSQSTQPSLLTNVITGYRKFLPFSTPDYSIASNKDVPDERVILFYGTFLPPDRATAKTTIAFYNNDFTKQYRLIITGFTDEGKPVTGYKTLD